MKIILTIVILVIVFNASIAQTNTDSAKYDYAIVDWGVVYPYFKIIYADSSIEIFDDSQEIKNITNIKGENSKFVKSFQSLFTTFDHLNKKGYELKSAYQNNFIFSKPLTRKSIPSEKINYEYSYATKLNGSKFYILYSSGKEENYKSGTSFTGVVSEKSDKQISKTLEFLKYMMNQGFEFISNESFGEDPKFLFKRRK
jgi:type IV secretory pathway ATPase VirB11/archaellum biosynthesis ATPase